MPRRQMHAEEVVEQCLYESGARGLSQHAREVALVGLLVVPDGAVSMREYRRRIRETYIKAHPERGSFFILFVLPVLISLISNWIAKWILSHTDMRTIRSQAFDALTESSPRMTDTLISISSPERKQTEP